MNRTNYQIEGMTMAVVNMGSMLRFYTTVFAIDFQKMEMFNSKLYSGTWGSLKLLLCPAAIAGNTATQNRHQVDIVVPDVREVIRLATEAGGKLMGDISEDDRSFSIGIYDPDHNSILFREDKA